MNTHEVTYLRNFAATRHVDHELGPYYCPDDEELGDIPFHPHDSGPDHPGQWCNWVPTDDGRHITWPGVESAMTSMKAEYWIAYLIQTFLQPGARLATELVSRVPGRDYAETFTRFTFDHVVNGAVDAQGEFEDDTWKIEVVDNVVTVRSKDGELSDPIVDPAPKMQVILRGGPHDGETHTIKVSPGFLELPDGSSYWTADTFDPDSWDGLEPVVLTPLANDGPPF